MSIFWVFFILSWTAYAAFVGLTAFLLYRVRGMLLFPYVTAAGLIVVPTLIMLVDQNAFIPMGPLTYGLSMASMILLMVTWFMSRGLPNGLVRTSRSISGVALLAAAFWSVNGPGGFFLPLLGVRHDELVFWHLLFAFIFLAVSVAIFFWLNRIPEEEPVVPERGPKARWLVLTIIGSWRFWLKVSVALLALFWLAQWSVPKQYGGLVNVWGEPGMSPEVLNDAEILCSGHFSPHWQPFRWCWDVQLKPEAAGFTYGRTIQARRKIIPFIVDHYWKGTGPLEIDVALFEPSERFWGDSWLLPAKENLLVALKKDTTGSGAYQLVNQVNSWLVISGSTQEKKKMDSTSPDKVVEAFALDYLEDYAAGPEAQRMIKLSAPLTIDSISGTGGTFEMQNGTILQQALATIKNFSVNDEKTIALLEKFMSVPGSPAKGGAFSALIKIDPVLSWKEGFALYEAKSLDPYTFSRVIPVVIRPEYLSQIDPAQIQELLESNPGMARDIARAFWQMSDHQTKDPRAIPWLGKCLSNPDVEVQYFGMMGLYEVCGKKEHFPTAFIALFKTDPQKYLAAYQAWWAQHSMEYVPVPQ